jgi:hypothetical protein
MSSNVTVEEAFRLRDEEGSIAVRKIRTRKGVRIELDPDDDDRMRIDALALESLSWQDEGVFSELLGQPHVIAPFEAYSESDLDEGATLTVSNEYATVRVHEIASPDGDRLRIEAPMKGSSLIADPDGLRGLVRQDPSIFSEFLETPHGPH